MFGRETIGVLSNIKYAQPTDQRSVGTASGYLPFVRINRLGRPLNNGKVFFQNQQTNRTKCHFPFAIRFPVFVFGWWETSKWEGNFRRSFPNGKRGLPLEVVYDFRTDFLENCCSIWLQTKITGFFAKWLAPCDPSLNFSRLLLSLSLAGRETLSLET